MDFDCSDKRIYSENSIHSNVAEKKKQMKTKINNPFTLHLNELYWIWIYVDATQRQKQKKTKNKYSYWALQK